MVRPRQRKSSPCRKESLSTVGWHQREPVGIELGGCIGGTFPTNQVRDSESVLTFAVLPTVGIAPPPASTPRHTRPFALLANMPTRSQSLRIGGSFAIMAAGSLGIILPVFLHSFHDGRAVPAILLLKAFAAGIIIALATVHLLTESYISLASLPPGATRLQTGLGCFQLNPRALVVSVLAPYGQPPCCEMHLLILRVLEGAQTASERAKYRPAG